MKKLLSIVVIASLMTACNDSSTKVDTTTADSAKMDESSTMATPPAAMDTSSAMNNSASMKDDLMTMKEGKMMVMKSGKWETMEKEMTCTNGCKVKPNGEVVKGDKKKMLTEGMMIDKDGQMMDKDGKMVDNSGW